MIKSKTFFSEIFGTFWRNEAKAQGIFNLPTWNNYSITNHGKFPVFHFLNRRTGAIDNGKYPLLKPIPLSVPETSFQP